MLVLFVFSKENERTKLSLASLILLALWGCHWSVFIHKVKRHNDKYLPSAPKKNSTHWNFFLIKRMLQNRDTLWQNKTNKANKVIQACLYSNICSDAISHLRTTYSTDLQNDHILVNRMKLLDLATDCTTKMIDNFCSSQDRVLAHKSAVDMQMISIILLQKHLSWRKILIQLTLFPHM